MKRRKSITKIVEMSITVMACIILITTSFSSATSIFPDVTIDTEALKENYDSRVYYNFSFAQIYGDKNQPLWMPEGSSGQQCFDSECILVKFMSGVDVSNSAKAFAQVKRITDTDSSFAPVRSVKLVP